MTGDMTAPAMTLDQIRAKHAWDVVMEIKRTVRDAKKLGRSAKKLPIRIMTAGLGPSLAFVEAKKEAPQLIEALSAWIAQRIPLTQAGEEKNLLRRIISGDSDFLRRATEEVLAWLQWFNRFAEAQDMVDEGNER